MVEVFKTNVEEALEAQQLVTLLQQHFPGGRINFDLQDCDRILRVEKLNVIPEKIIELMHIQGYTCQLLD